MKAPEYNARELTAGRATWRDVSDLVAAFQRANGLVADGKLGPKTRAALRPAKKPEIPVTLFAEAPPEWTVDHKGWLQGDHVVHIPISSWYYYSRLSTFDGQPKGVVEHYTATDHGTGESMARRRQAKGARETSWHLTVEPGRVIQMMPFTCGAWHAGSKTAVPVPGVGWANDTCIGIELTGHGDAFPESQVRLYARALRALVRAYSIPQRAIVGHRDIDPSRRDDPGDVWVRDHRPRVIRFAYG